MLLNFQQIFIKYLFWAHQWHINCFDQDTFVLYWASISSVQFSRSVVSDSLRPNESQHTRLPCPSPTPGVHSDSRPSSQWCHPAISSSVVPYSSCPQPLPASESFLMSQLFTWGGQSTGFSALASFLPEKSQGWSPYKRLVFFFFFFSFFQLWRPGSPKPTSWPTWFLVTGTFLTCTWPFFCHVLTRLREWASSGILYFFIKRLIPSVIPLSYILVNLITFYKPYLQLKSHWGLELQQMNFGGIISIQAITHINVFSSLTEMTVFQRKA